MVHEYELGQLEAIGAGAALVLCLLVPQRWTRRRFWIESQFARLASHKALSVLLVMALALGGRLALIDALGIPSPSIHDEFSYLLAGDTFAAGRLTNPPHPMWVHFETFHVLQQPTYQSKYSPMQGLWLALGERIFGQPWFGVWLSVGLMCGALTWALYQWLPPSWALLGGVLCVIRIGWFSYWMNSYWGGAGAALGGALVLGALPRIMRRARASDALVLAAGVAILANSRPYEGFAMALAVAIVLSIWLIRRNALTQSDKLTRVVLPVAAALIIAFAWMGYYNFRVTGNALRMPYIIHERTYSLAASFVFQTPEPLHGYRHRSLFLFYRGWEYVKYKQAISWPTLKLWNFNRARDLWGFYLGPLFSLAVLAAPWVIRDRRVRVPLIVFAAVLVALIPEVWTHPHYFAPATAAFYVLLMQALRHLRYSRRYPNFAVLALAIPLICVVLAALRTGTPPAGAHDHEYDTWCCSAERPIPYWREVNAILGNLPGEQLVFVRYTDAHSVHEDWINNRADIDASRVVWARAMDPANDAELLRYYPHRRAWLLEPDSTPPKLVPYSIAAGALQSTASVAR